MCVNGWLGLWVRNPRASSSPERRRKPCVYTIVLCMVRQAIANKHKVTNAPSLMMSCVCDVVFTYRQGRPRSFGGSDTGTKISMRRRELRITCYSARHDIRDDRCDAKSQLRSALRFRRGVRYSIFTIHDSVPA